MSQPSKESLFFVGVWPCTLDKVLMKFQDLRAQMEAWYCINLGIMEAYYYQCAPLANGRRQTRCYSALDKKG